MQNNGTLLHRRILAKKGNLRRDAHSVDVRDRSGRASTLSIRATKVLPSIIPAKGTPIVARVRGALGARATGWAAQPLAAAHVRVALEAGLAPVYEVIRCDNARPVGATVPVILEGAALIVYLERTIGMQPGYRVRSRGQLVGHIHGSKGKAKSFCTFSINTCMAQKDPRCAST